MIYILFILIVIVRVWLIYFIVKDPKAYFASYPRSANLVPFTTLKFYIDPARQFVSLLDVIGNLLIFVPCGIYIHLFNKGKKLWLSILLSFIVCLAVESTQYILATGVFDVDDILINFLGSLAGIFCAYFLYRLLKEPVFTQSVAIIGFSLVPYLFLTTWLYVFFPDKQGAITGSIPVLLAFHIAYFVSLLPEKRWVKRTMILVIIPITLAYFFLLMPSINIV